MSKVFTEKEMRDFAIWTDLQKFELSCYLSNVTKIIETSKNDNSTKEELIQLLEDAHNKLKEQLNSGSAKFFGENLKDAIDKIYN